MIKLTTRALAETAVVMMKTESKPFIYDVGRPSSESLSDIEFEKMVPASLDESASCRGVG